MPSPIYVIGHRNPDTDAICSAIAYADLKNRLSPDEHLPARCGNSNARIEAVLDKFQQPLPLFIGDVTPRVRDIMISQPVCANPWNTCAEALEVIEKHDIRVLPLVDAQRQLLGTLSVFQLGEYFIPKPKAPRAMRHVRTTLGDIARSLGAQPIHLYHQDRLEDLYVRVGAMDIRSFGKFANEEPTLASQSIIVVGDRWDIQQKSIQARVRLLILTGGLSVDEEVAELAREKEVSLIVSPYDSASTSWIVRTAARVEGLANKTFTSFAAGEKLSTVRRRLATKPAQACMVIDDQGRLEGIFTNGDLLKASGTRLILVDHNELSQAVPGAELASILEIIDHHRLGNPPTQQPILFVNEPVGSTCTIVADLFRRHQLVPSRAMAGLLMGGMISDTLNLNSPTTTAKDGEILAWLAPLAGLIQDELARLVFSSGSVILSKTPAEVVLGDMKVYEEGKLRYSVSQIEELGFGNFHAHAEGLLAALDELCRTEQLLFAALLVTDINTQNSILAIRGDAEFIAQIKYSPVEEGSTYDLPGIVSRKKQLIPYFTSALRSLGLIG